VFCTLANADRHWPLDFTDSWNTLAENDVDLHVQWILATNGAQVSIW